MKYLKVIFIGTALFTSVSFAQGGYDSTSSGNQQSQNQQQNHQHQQNEQHQQNQQDQSQAQNRMQPSNQTEGRIVPMQPPNKPIGY